MSLTHYPPLVVPQPAEESRSVPGTDRDVPHAFRWVVEHLDAIANAGARFTGCAEELACIVAKSAGLINTTCAWRVNGVRIEQAWDLRTNPQLIVDAIRDDRVRSALYARGVSLSHSRVGKTEQRIDVPEGRYLTTLKKKT